MPLPALVLCALALAVHPAAQPGTCTTGAGAATIRCDIPIPEDSLLYLETVDVSRVLVMLNGVAFKLASDPAEVARSANAFPLPRTGAITVDIGGYLMAGPNTIELRAQGPPGSDLPRVFIANVLLDGQAVAYRVGGLELLPSGLDVVGFPNPSMGAATLRYTIPEDRVTGVPVHLAVYDVRGRRVRVLVDEVRFPGTFEARWDGTATGGDPVASGVYLVRLRAGAEQQTARLTRVR